MKFDPYLKLDPSTKLDRSCGPALVQIWPGTVQFRFGPVRVIDNDVTNLITFLGLVNVMSHQGSHRKILTTRRCTLSFKRLYVMVIRKVFSETIPDFSDNYQATQITVPFRCLPDSHVSTVETSDETLTGDSILGGRSGIPFFRSRSGDEVNN